MSVDPDDAEAVDSLRDTPDSPDVRAAAATDHDRPGGERIRNGCGLLLQRVALDDGDLRIRKRDPRAFGHRLASGSPRRRHAHHPCREGAPAAVTLVPVADRHRRERPAVRTARAQGAHGTLFSWIANCAETCIPTDS